MSASAGTSRTEGGDVGHAFAVFYAGVICAAACAPVLIGALADATGRQAALACAASPALAAIPLAFVLARMLRKRWPA